MIATPVLPALESIPVDAVLADAVVLNWGDLMPEPTTVLIHIEYHVEALGSIEFLKVWASTVRGHWNLICEYWMRSDATHRSGLHFSNS